MGVGVRVTFRVGIELWVRVGVGVGVRVGFEVGLVVWVVVKMAVGVKVKVRVMLRSGSALVSGWW